MLNITEKAINRAKDLINFIDNSPTAYQAVEEEKKILEEAGFSRLDPEDRWRLKKASAYYVEVSDATLFAFRTGDGPDSGFNILGAHNDSPGFQIKESMNMNRSGYGQLNVEPYGGLILRTWLDRPLSVAGRILIKDDSEKGYKSLKIDLKKPVLIIPSLAIHMDREVNRSGELKPQNDMAPIWCVGEEEADFLELVSKEVGVERSRILSYDLFLYDVEKGVLLGSESEFISIGRLDNLAMCHAAVSSLVESKASSHHQLIALHDNEEIGSMTRRGADSVTLRDILSRIIMGLGGDREDFLISLSKSFTVSCDMAHALHPNHVGDYDPTNKVLLNNGPVLKYSASKSYITDGEGAAKVRMYANKKGIDFQTFHNNSDKRGGATIGAMDEQWTGILNADVGNPVLGMHSIRELAGVMDHDQMIEFMSAFFE